MKGKAEKVTKYRRLMGKETKKKTHSRNVPKRNLGTKNVENIKKVHITANKGYYLELKFYNANSNPVFC